MHNMLITFCPFQLIPDLTRLIPTKYDPFQPILIIQEGCEQGGCC